MANDAIYPGSFAPVTLGHLDVIQQAAKLFDCLYIAVSPSDRGVAAFSISEKQQWLHQATESISNIKIVALEGSLVELADKLEVSWVVRGLRSSDDFAYEQQMAHMNNTLNNSIQTMFLIAKPEHQYISATLVRQLIACKKDVSQFIPQACHESALRLLSVSYTHLTLPTKA